MPCVEGDRSDCQPLTTTIALSLRLRAIELASGWQSDLSPSTQGMIFIIFHFILFFRPHSFWHFSGRGIPGISILNSTYSSSNGTKIILFRNKSPKSKVHLNLWPLSSYCCSSSYSTLWGGIDGTDWILFRFYLFPRNVAFHLLFLYSTSSYSQNYQKECSLSFMAVQKDCVRTLWSALEQDYWLLSSCLCYIRKWDRQIPINSNWWEDFWGFQTWYFELLRPLEETSNSPRLPNQFRVFLFTVRFSFGQAFQNYPAELSAIFGWKVMINTYSMKQPDLYYFEAIKMTSQAWSDLYGEYEPQASILCELWLGLWRHFYGFKIV